jgi:hypothetical protein
MTENVQSSSSGSKRRRAVKPQAEPTSAPVETSLEASAQPSQKRGLQRPDRPVKTETEKIAEVADLFNPPVDGLQEPQAAPARPDPAPSPAVDQAGEEDAVSPTGVSSPEPDDDTPTLERVAEALEVEAKDLYAIEVPVGDNGETISLGALKDAYKNQTEAERMLTERRQQADQRDMQLLQDQHYMANVLEAMRGQLTPQMAQYIESNDKRIDAEERLALTRVAPEIADKTSRVQFIDKAVKHMSRITGRSEEESAMRLGLLRGRGSAMDIKFLHEAVKAMDELERLKGLRTAAETQNKPKSKRSGGRKGVSDALTRARKIAAGGSEADKAKAVAALLGGQK